ncbi:Transglutaminase-activating metalloprotease [Streptomyces sp. RB5]|uniref:Transglutaminase-activating metalloprotease n=1 Tax=Streptomyces smaragdinus TaxID=2585196 RepID=A0A7K0CNF9_9ACTN|nr:M4 family metallopeptidase [Streptomyces smaragdinus]MQY14813.1 Transglutaminase-activating metalloprotease [Streptomyces smaragdinus]
MNSPTSSAAPRRPHRQRLAVTVALTAAALTLSALPATAGTGPDTAAPTAQLRVKANPAHQATSITPAHRKQLLAEKADKAPATARTLKLGAHEKLIPKDVVLDADGTVHTRYDRTYAGLPVIGGDLVVHEGPAGRTVTYASQTAPAVPTTTAEVPAATAKKTALGKAADQGTRKAKAGKAPRLVVWTAGGKARLAWQTVVTGVQKDGSPSERHVVTDAASETVLANAEHIRSAEGRSLYSGTVTIGSTRRDDGSYELVDPQRGGHRTLDATATSAGVLFTDTDDVWGDGTAADPQTAAVDAAYGAQTTWDFYHDRFGRNGIADDGRGSYSRVHYQATPGVPLANANWQDGCFCMSYGDGADGKHPVTSLDIAAHEMAHGVTSATAGLGDFGESPALNEAISDMMAAAVEFHADNPADVPDYLMAELDDLHGDGKPIRYMDEPSKAGISAVGYAPLDYWSPETKNAEAHMAAGVGAHFFYLLAEGSGKKTINGVAYDSPTYDGLPVTGIGLTSATDVMYRALTVYMTSTTDYPGARTATLRAAADLYGAQSDGYEAVANAWAGVNLGIGYVNHIGVERPATEPVATGQPVSRRIVASSTRPGALAYSARSLPRGLSIDPASGLISGTPDKAGEYDTAITITNGEGDTRTLAFTWTVVESGGHYFTNPTHFVIPEHGTVESPMVVRGRPGSAPSDLKVTVDITHPFGLAMVIDLVAPDGTVVPVKPWGPWVLGPDLHATYTVDASAVSAVGTWKLRVFDGTPGIFDMDEGELQGWSMSF